MTIDSTAARTPTHDAGIDALRRSLDGSAFAPDDPEFSSLRRSWNLSFEHRPAVIVQPSHTADVATTIEWATALGFPVAVQATGHGVIRLADRAVLILTSNLDEVTIDADAWTARIGAGAKWEKVLGPAGAAGLAPLLGSTPDVSAVGYTLGGGMGWLARKFGLSADHVRSIEIVTADAQVRIASPDSDTDLFWALRGGGAGSLGVVTSIEIDLVPVTRMYAGNLLYPASMARDVGARYREWVTGVPDELTSSISFMNFPPFEEVPEPIRGKSFAIVRGAFVGSDRDGEQLLDHWRSWREPELDVWGPMPFTDVATISNDPLDPMPGMSTSEWLEVINDDVIDILASALFEQDGPSPLTFAEIRHAGGAIAREPASPNAYRFRHLPHVLQLVGVAGGPDLIALEQFVRHLQNELRPHACGPAYLNFLEGAEKIARTRAAFGSTAFERLQRIKADVDPANVFGHGLPLA